MTIVALAVAVAGEGVVAVPPPVRSTSPAFEILLSLGWSVPFGTAFSPDPNELFFDLEALDQRVSSGPRFGAAVAYYLTPHFGLVGQASASMMSSGVPEGAATSWYAGLGLRWRFLSDDRGGPWAGAGVGYERLLRTSNHTESQDDVYAWAGDTSSSAGALNVSVGWSRLVSRHVAFGPLIDIGFGRYKTHTARYGNTVRGYLPGDDHKRRRSNVARLGNCRRHDGLPVLKEARQGRTSGSTARHLVFYLAAESGQENQPFRGATNRVRRLHSHSSH